LERSQIANYEVKVSKLSGGSLGVYLPKDLVRVMQLEGGERALITPISPVAFVVSLAREEPYNQSGLQTEDVLLL
jgi:antitoxin component of MazEF toxin-antitoxin module